MNEFQKKNSSIRVVVGMSGGVDSSVAALLLKQQGYDVIGVFMKNWEDESEHCTAEKDYQDVRKVCEQLEIPYYTFNFSEQYYEKVFQDFLKDYQKGFTPNPDILCNREIKFQVFFEKAMSLGAHFVATGHYAQTENRGDQVFLKKAKDLTKDQSYFLHQVSDEALEKTLFPLGGLLKSEVREMAKKNKLATSEKKDSTGICFIGKRDFKDFLSNYVSIKKGEFRNLKDEVVGTHDGCAFYTLGQRKGLGLGGPGEPWFVIKKDHEKNIVYVDRGEDHEDLYSSTLWFEDFFMINSKVKKEDYFKKPIHAKVRYRQKDQACILEPQGHGYVVKFLEKQRAITPGQSVVFYDQDLCLGGGQILRTNVL